VQTIDRRYSGGIWIALLLGLVIVSLGCGRKSLPRPPRQIYPPAIEEVQATLTANTVELSWKVPATDRWINSRPSSFLIYRAVTAREPDACPSCPVDFELWAVIEMQDYDEVPQPGAELSILDVLSLPGVYVYRIRIRSKTELEGPMSPQAIVNYVGNTQK
jgi:hypothetical protein